jgi:glucose-1-phosphate thymidylyltransferase
MQDSQRYGAIKSGTVRKALSIGEKPRMLKSHYAVTGPYFHDGSVRDIAAGLRPSHGTSSKTTGINQAYLSAGRWPESRAA